MSIRIMTLAWETTLADSEKLILLALADWSNDDGQCWPSVAQLAKKSSKSERTVQAALKRLEAADHIERDQRPGRGCRYLVHPRNGCTPAAVAPRKDRTPAMAAPPQRTTETPAAAAPNTSRTTIPTKASPSSVKRERANATRVPTNFEPRPADGSLTANAMDAWPPGEREEQVEHFVDHHTAAGTLSKDWQASWRTWVNNWKRFNGKRSHHRPADRIRNSLVAACAVAATGGPAG